MTSSASLHKPLQTILIMIAITLCPLPRLHAQQTIPLYPDTIPNSKPSAAVPQLICYPAKPEIANKTAMVICPGGGYGVLVMDREGIQIADALNKVGVTCFVLKYRLPNTTTMIDPSIGPLQDAQQAIKTIRENAAKWNIDPRKIGIMGFSAGGHLASTAGTHFQTGYIKNEAHTSLRPDFMILIYPVISMLDSLTHPGSKKNLLGPNPPDSTTHKFSNECQVTGETPPTFLMHASDDELVKVSNTIAFYNALLNNAVPAGMHIFAQGRHGFLQEPAKSNYLSYCIAWLRENRWLN